MRASLLGPLTALLTLSPAARRHSAEFAYTRLAADVNNKKFSGLSRRGLDCHSALAVAVSHRDSLYMPFEGSTRYDNKERGGAE